MLGSTLNREDIHGLKDIHDIHVQSIITGDSTKFNAAKNQLNAESKDSLLIAGDSTKFNSQSKQ